MVYDLLLYLEGKLSFFNKITAHPRRGFTKRVRVERFGAIGLQSIIFCARNTKAEKVTFFLNES